MSTEPTTQEGLNWSPPEPTPVVAPAAAGHDRPAGSAAPVDPPRPTAEAEAEASGDGSPLDGVIAKLPPNVQEKPEALVGVAFGAGIGAAIVLRVLGGILR